MNSQYHWIIKNNKVMAMYQSEPLQGFEEKNKAKTWKNTFKNTF